MVRHLALAGLALVALSGPAHAQIFRAYLSAAGSDANPCTLPAPCRLLPAALNAVADGGEVWMLDSANYNATTVVIGKSVSILSVPGAQGSLVANSATAVQVNGAGLSIAFRNVSFVPIATARVIGSHGLRVVGASSITVDRCVFAGLPGDGIRLEAGDLSLIDTVIRDGGAWGVEIATVQGASSRVTIAATRLLRNDSGGVSAAPGGTALVSLSDSTIVGNGAGKGVEASTSLPGAIAQVMVHRSSVQFLLTAFSSVTNGFGFARLAALSNALAYNSTDMAQGGTGSVIATSGDNFVGPFSTNNTGSTTTAMTK